MKRYVNFYVSEHDPQQMLFSENYETAEKARRIYEEAADHPWLKYKAVAVPTEEFSIDEMLRK